MAERDQVRGALARLDGRYARHPQHVAFLRVALADHRQGGRLHDDASGGAGAALGVRLAADVDHVGLAVGVEMGEFAHLLAAS